MQTLDSFLDLIRHGGFMMYPLLLSALIALTVIFERLYLLKNTYALPAPILQEIKILLRTGKTSEVHSKTLSSASPVALVIKKAMEHYHSPQADLERLMANEAERTLPQLEKRLEILDTIITAAPLMGLLGTITGMMASFQILSQKGVNEPNAITGGVAEALIATATGLVIALVCLLAYNYFNAIIKHTIEITEEMANLILENKIPK